MKTKSYKVDWNKVKTKEDFILIGRFLDVCITMHYPMIKKKMKHLLKAIKINS